MLQVIDVRVTSPFNENIPLGFHTEPRLKTWFIYMSYLLAAYFIKDDR